MYRELGFLFFVLSFTLGANILFIPAHGIASHSKSMYPFAEQLSSMDHHVYMLQILRETNKKTKSENVTDLYLTVPATGDSKADQPNHPSTLWSKNINRPLSLYYPWYFSATVCQDVLNRPDLLKRFLYIVKQKWDLIVVDTNYAPCGVIATQFNDAPWFDFSTSLVGPNVLNPKGPQWNAAISPGFRPDGKFEPRKFWDRLWSAFDTFIVLRIMDSLEYAVFHWLDSPIASKFSLEHFHASSSLALGSIPPDLDFAHAKSTNVIEMDGSCGEYGALSEPYASFVNDPKSKGTILFAMGHCGSWEYAPRNYLLSFVEAFNELTDYRIIWQYVGKGPKPKVLPHIMLSSWLPQNEILHHNKTVLFISHVGFKSLREAICASTPIVALPMFAEQLRNAAIVKRKKFGEVIKKRFITKSRVLRTMKKVLEDPSYKSNVEKVHDFLDDRLADPLELGAFWTNFMLKYASYSIKLFQHNIPSRFTECSVPFCCTVFIILFVMVLI